jgi:hypothetical protein
LLEKAPKALAGIRLDGQQKQIAQKAAKITCENSNIRTSRRREVSKFMRMLTAFMRVTNAG